MLQRSLTEGPAATAPRLAVQAAFALYLLVLAGFYWTPSEVAGLYVVHDAVAFYGLLPVVVLLFGADVVRVVRASPVALASTLFVAFMATSIAWGSGAADRSAGTALLHAAATFAFVAAGAILLDAERVEVASRFVVFCGALFSAIALVLHVVVRSPGGADRLTSPVSRDHPNVIAYMLGFGAIVALHRLLRAGPAVRSFLPNAVALGLLLAALLLTRGRLTLLSFLFASVVAIARAPDRRHARGAAAVLLATISLAGILSSGLLHGIVGRSDAGRGTIWADLLRRSEGHRLFGSGLTATDDVVFPPGSPDFPAGHVAPHAHSLLVGTFFAGGIVGLSLLVGVVSLAIRKGLRLAAGGSPFALTLLAYGAAALSMNGQWAISGPHDASWLLIWLPVGLVAGTEARGAPAPVPDTAVPRPGGAGRLPAWLFSLAATILVAIRLPGLGGPVTEPDGWRQFDALFTIRAFAREGIDLLHPPVAWLGTKGVALFGFPVAEALSSLALRLAGGGLAAPRAVFLLFFCGALFSIHSIARRFGGRTRARWVVLAGLALPAGIVFSRALLPDATGLAFACGAAAALLSGLSRRRPGTFAAGALLLSLALVVKPAFVVPFVPLLLAVALRRRTRRFAARAAVLLVVPLAAFLWWQGHVTSVGRETVEPGLYAGAARPVNDLTRSVSWQDSRFRARPWLRVGEGLVRDLTSPGLLAAAILGGLLAVRRSGRIAALLAAGAVLYVGLFLPACARHGWELLALLPVVALLAGDGLAWACRCARAGVPLPLRLAAFAGAGFVLLGGVFAARGAVRSLDPAIPAAGAAIASATSPSEVVVVSWGDSDGRNPYLLVAADRRGWSVPEGALSEKLIRTLAARGATKLAVLSAQAPAFLDPAPRAGLPAGGGGKRIRIWELRRAQRRAE